MQPMLGGKPIQISGKPFAQAKGLVQLAGKGGQPLGLIRTPQGPLTAINVIPQPLTTSTVGVSVSGKLMGKNLQSKCDSG